MQPIQYTQRTHNCKADPDHRILEHWNILYRHIYIYIYINIHCIVYCLLYSTEWDGCAAGVEGYVPGWLQLRQQAFSGHHAGADGERQVPRDIGKLI